MASKWNVTLFLYKTKAISTLKDLISRKEPSITREACNLISEMLSRPDDMLVWLKMDSSNPCVNSAMSDDFMILQVGEPKRLPKDRGIYRNWGAFFD